MKRLLLFYAFMLTFAVVWAHDVEIDGIYYNLDNTNKTAEVTYKGKGLDYNSYRERYSDSVIIPESITYNTEIYSITSIGNYAFYHCYGLTSITIPNSVTSIGSYAFHNCNGLTSITIPNSVTSIGISAFNYCTGLTEIIVLSNNKNFTSDNGVLFNKDKTTLIRHPQGKKSTDYSIPNSVTAIDVDAFYGCSGLTSISIPNSVTSIGNDAFSGCSGLTSISIPNSVTSIGSGAFFYCGGLTSITIPNSVTNIGSTAFSWCSGLTSITIPNSVTSIGSGAFFYCGGLTSITIPNSVTSIGYEAFSNCKGLTSITIPNSVTSIGKDAFYNCKALTKVNYLGTIDDWVEIDFHSSRSNPTYYAKDLYINDKLLTDVKITTADSIKQYAFYWYNKISSVEIGNSVTFIGDDVFDGSNNLKKIKVASDNKNFSSDNGVLFNKDKTILIRFLEGNDYDYDSYEIPNSVTSIGSGAFFYCGGLTSITIPNSVTSIGDEAFLNCNGLTSIAIPNSVTSIGSSAFDDCDGLTSVTIGNSVTSIGAYAFYGCEALTKVNYLGTVDKWVEIDFKSNPTYYAKDLYINDELLTDIKITSADSIKQYAFDNCASIKSVEIGNNVTYVSYSAFSGCSGLTSVIWNAKNCKDFGWSSAPFDYISSNITSFTFGDKVEHIPALLCSDMSKLTEITIPNSVTSIGLEAFYGCSGLTSVTIPNSVTSIGDAAFYDCEALTKVNYLGTVDKWVGIDFEDSRSNPTYYAKDLYINDKLLTDVKITTADSIKQYAFDNCASIKSVEIGNNVTYVSYYAFDGCSGLTSVIWNAKNHKDFNWFAPFDDSSSNITSFTFGDNVEYIPEYVCYSMSNLKEVVIGKNVTSIGNSAFSGCTGITSVVWNAKNIGNINFSYYDNPFNDSRSNITSFTFGDDVEHIPGYLCYSMNNLKEVTIGKNVTSIEDSAFGDYSGLIKVNYLGTIDKWVKIEQNGALNYYAKDLYINDELLTDVKITTADSIKQYAFFNFQSIKSVEIGKSVTFIGPRAFDGCSGLTKVNYLGTVDEWVEIDFNGYDSNPTYYSKDLYINDELLTDVKITTADSIKQYAFLGCQSIKSVEIGNSVTSIGFSAFYGCSGLTSITIPNSVTNIGSIAFSGCSGLTSITIPNSVTSISNDMFGDCSELTSVTIGEGVEMISTSAFRGCEKLVKITALPTSVPKVHQNSFTHYNAELYVPCDVYDEYYNNKIFGLFKEIKCIEAEEVEGSDKVEIEVDENNNATIVWPFVDSASSYELVISKDGVVFCTLIFNENGQLTSIDFGNRAASVGFQFTVTGLEEASKYDYVIEAKDKVGNVLKSYKGTFTTNGYNSDTAILETLADANITVSGGMISADKEFSIYNTLGKDVTALNGSLQPGIYVVVLGEDRVKVMVK